MPVVPLARISTTLLLVAVASILALPSVTAPARAQQTSRHFSETGQNVAGRFLRYWDAHGALAQQGFPISPEFREKSDLNGKSYTVQYFERAVFEYHPENASPNDVLLSQLGTSRYRQKYPTGAPVGAPPPGDGSQLFTETGFTVHGLFLDYWQKQGGLAQQGYPISEPLTETSELNGKSYTVQYFERAVFEYHPEYAGTTNQVLLSQLGTFMLKAKYGGTAPATGVLKINTVHNPTKDEGPKEYAEIANTGAATQDLAGWAIRTASSRVTPFKFPAGTQLAPGAAVRVVSGLKATASGPDEYLWRSAYTWCNEGDAATLLDPEGTVADRLFYGKPVDLGSGKTACAK